MPKIDCVSDFAARHNKRLCHDPPLVPDFFQCAENFFPIKMTAPRASSVVLSHVESHKQISRSTDRITDTALFDIHVVSIEENANVGRIDFLYISTCLRRRVDQNSFKAVDRFDPVGNAVPVRGFASRLMLSAL